MIFYCFKIETFLDNNFYVQGAKKGNQGERNAGQALGLNLLFLLEFIKAKSLIADIWTWSFKNKFLLN